MKNKHANSWHTENLQEREQSSLVPPELWIDWRSKAVTIARRAALAIGSALLLPLLVAAQQGNITTVAGGSPATMPKLNGAVNNVASTGEVGQIAWDATRQVFYFTSSTFHRVYKYDPAAGQATAVAGTGSTVLMGMGAILSKRVLLARWASFSIPQIQIFSILRTRAITASAASIFHQTPLTHCSAAEHASRDNLLPRMLRLHQPICARPGRWRSMATACYTFSILGRVQFGGSRRGKLK